MGRRKHRALVKRLTGSDLGWFGAARRSGAALGNQRGITLDADLMRDLFSDELLESDEILLNVARAGESSEQRPLRRQQKNWRLVGNKVEGEGLDDLAAGDLFVARFGISAGEGDLVWQVCSRGHDAWLPLDALCGEASSVWFDPHGDGWSLVENLLGDDTSRAKEIGAALPAEKSMRSADDDHVEPAPGALIESLRGLGYSLPTAIADLIDNSIAAGATTVWLDFTWSGSKSTMVLRDDGRGMDLAQLRNAMRVGSRSPRDKRDASDLGRFGLGLKTASFSQARRLTVASRRAGASTVLRVWDLDQVVKENSWTLIAEASPDARSLIAPLAKQASGTSVVWENLDRIVGKHDASDAQAEKRFLRAIAGVRDHLAMVFHRWLDPEDEAAPRIKIVLNGLPIKAWDPFLEAFTQTENLPEVRISRNADSLAMSGFVLPHHDSFADSDARDKAGGPNGWYGQQGFYVYRQRRLLVAGSWLGLGTPRMWIREQQTRLARIRLDLSNAMDEDWHIDLKKSDARPPAWARSALEQYGENVRTRARQRLIRRVAATPVAGGARPVERAWLAQNRPDGRIGYKVSREHPVVKQVIAGASDPAAVTAMLRLVEETIPLQQIWLTQADKPELAPKPFDGDRAAALVVLREIYAGLRKSLSPAEARIAVRFMEPFNSMPDLIEQLVD